MAGNCQALPPLRIGIDITIRHTKVPARALLPVPDALSDEAAAALPCPATEVLSPINESPWELGKLVFWPYLTAALLLWRLEPLESASRGGHCAALLAATALMVLLCRFLWGVLPLWLLFCGAAAGAMALYHFLLRRRLPGGELLWYLLAILLGVAYLLLTALPLTGGIFLDPRDAAAMATIPY